MIGWISRVPMDMNEIGLSLRLARFRLGSAHEYCKALLSRESRVLALL